MAVSIDGGVNRDDWAAEGCLPPDENAIALQKLQEKIQRGEVTPIDSTRIAENLLRARVAGTLSHEVFCSVSRLLQALER